MMFINYNIYIYISVKCFYCTHNTRVCRYDQNKGQKRKKQGASKSIIFFAGMRVERFKKHKKKRRNGKWIERSSKSATDMLSTVINSVVGICSNI